MLKEAKSSITVIAFIILNAKTSNYNVDALRGQAVNKLLTCVLPNHAMSCHKHSALYQEDTHFVSTHSL